MTTESEILEWLITTIAHETNCEPASIDPTKSAHTLGIDSALIVSLTSDLEAKFGLPLDLSVLYAQPSLAAFAAHLAASLPSDR